MNITDRTCYECGFVAPNMADLGRHAGQTNHDVKPPATLEERMVDTHSRMADHGRRMVAARQALYSMFIEARAEGWTPADTARIAGVDRNAVVQALEHHDRTVNHMSNGHE